jgi:hypothetical protein
MRDTEHLMPRRNAITGLREWTTPEVVVETGVSERTLYRWMKQEFVRPRNVVGDDGRARAIWDDVQVENVKTLRRITGRGVPAELVMERWHNEAWRWSTLGYEQALYVRDAWRAPTSGAALAAELNVNPQWYDTRVTGDELRKARMVSGSAGNSIDAMSLVECFDFMVKALVMRVCAPNDHMIGRMERSIFDSLLPALYNLITGVPPVLAIATTRCVVVSRTSLPLLHHGADEADVLQLIKSDSHHEGTDVLNALGPVFVSVSLTPVLRILWRAWQDDPETRHRPVSGWPGQNSVQPVPDAKFESPEIVWERRPDGSVIEYDAETVSWARDPPAATLDVKVNSARLVSAAITPAPARTKKRSAKPAHRNGRKRS